MAEPKDTPTDKDKARQPYEAPKVVYREPLEAVATTCTPAPPAKGNPATCPTGPISS